MESSTPLGIGGSSCSQCAHSPADETEADVIGGEIAASRAGYDPRAAVTLWNKIDTATRRMDNGFIWMRPHHRGPPAGPGPAQAHAGHDAALCESNRQDGRPVAHYAGMGRFKKSGR